MRRLAAILCADVVGYSAMMEADEAETLRVLKAHRGDLFDPAVGRHSGRIVKLMGDGALVEFPSVVDAVSCAVEIQTSLAEGDAPIRLRIGINLGDVIAEGEDIYGDGVNIAARLQDWVGPGGIAIAGIVQESLGRQTAAAFADRGLHRLKNIGREIRIFTWCESAAAPAEQMRAAPLALPDKPSIAVLPFDNMSGDPEQEFFADGVVEAITAALSRIRSFFVIARNSAFAYKGRAKNICEIGRELGVGYVLEGSVQRAGGRVRITTQLIETRGGSHLWAERYDGALDDIFELQDRITEQVAGALEPSIRHAEIDRSRRKPPQDLGAYDHAMRALPHVWMLEKDAATKALALLDEALEADPAYPLALALAAWCWAQRSVYNWTDDIPEAQRHALDRAERAASLSTEDPLILAVLGAVHTFAKNYGAARVLLERAIQLDPNAAWALSRFGWLEVYAGNPDPARAHFERAMRLSPLDPMNFNNLVGIGCTHQIAGEDDAAAGYFQRALDERPNALWIHRNLAPALLAAGREAEARASYRALIAAYPSLTVQKFTQAMVFFPDVIERIAQGLRALGVPDE